MGIKSFYFQVQHVQRICMQKVLKTWEKQAYIDLPVLSALIKIR